MEKSLDNAVIWYFAYGSNMNAAKFIGSRGIRPKDVARVSLPDWKLTMEIPGLPYSEPAFSSIQPLEKVADLEQPDVIGVAYLINHEQYRKVIASEGGGVAYKDILVDSRPVGDEDAIKTGPRLQVRTLGSAMQRTPPARPSYRYMHLILVGASEARLPAEYQRYLKDTCMYKRPDSRWTRLGAGVFTALWYPIMALMERLIHATIQSDGNAPCFAINIVRFMMAVIWLSHDAVFAPIFGRGDGRADENLAEKELQADHVSLPCDDYNLVL